MWVWLAVRHQVSHVIDVRPGQVVAHFLLEVIWNWAPASLWPWWISSIDNGWMYTIQKYWQWKGEKWCPVWEFLFLSFFLFLFFFSVCVWEYVCTRVCPLFQPCQCLIDGPVAVSPCWGSDKSFVSFYRVFFFQ